MIISYQDLISNQEDFERQQYEGKMPRHHESRKKFVHHAVCTQ